jgi:hypothetical protein
MTRAVRLLAAGDLAGSLHMHPLAVPVLAVNLAFAFATVWLTLRDGSPFRAWSWRPGRAIVVGAGVIYVLALMLWLARFAGALGGPVPVSYSTARSATGFCGSATTAGRSVSVQAPVRSKT